MGDPVQVIRKPFMITLERFGTHSKFFIRLYTCEFGLKRALDYTNNLSVPLASWERGKEGEIPFRVGSSRALREKSLGVFKPS